MPTEWPPKQPAPKPSGPDPDAVRRALADYDQACADFRSDKMTCAQLQYLRANLSAVFIEAAREWLAQQDEASE